MKLKFALCLLLLLLSSCSSLPDQDLVGDEHCTPPCWRGIIPGKTSKNDAIQILMEAEDEGEGDLSIPENIVWRDETEKNYSLATDNDIIKTITLKSVTSTKLSDLIALFGDPSYAVITRIRDGYFLGMILYPDKGLAFLVSENNEKFEVKSNTKVIQAIYLEASDLPTMINTLVGKNRVEGILDSTIEWKGYGSIIP